MSQMNPNRMIDPETLVQCPYEKTHMVRVLRWPRHIIKCRRSHPTDDLRSCPFNARHEVPYVELRHHIAMCPDQVLIHQEILHRRVMSGELEGGPKGNTEVPSYIREEAIPLSAENWDEEYEHVRVVVDPSLNSKSMAGPQPQGLTQSQRREYRKLLIQLSDFDPGSDQAEEIRRQMKSLGGPERTPVFTGQSAMGNQALCTMGTESRYTVEKPARVPRAEREARDDLRMRMPRGPPQVDTLAKMNGVKTKTDSSQNSRLAANFSRLVGVGRGGRCAGMALPEQIDARYEILAKLAAGRGVPKPLPPPS